MIVQIYEIQDPHEAERCIEAGVNHIGSVILSETEWKNPEIREVVRLSKGSGAKNSIIPLFKKIDTLYSILDYYRPDFIHFCDTLTDGYGKDIILDELVGLQSNIRERFPEVLIIRSIPIPVNLPEQGFPTIEISERFEELTDYFLTDTWLGKEPVEGFIGITGKTCDPGIARELVSHSRIPVILAGGLSPENVYESILNILPSGADSCTQTNLKDSSGRTIRFKKDFKRVRRFVEEVRRAEQAVEDKRKKIQKEILELRLQLRDREEALPAHSVRPHQIQIIEELEDQIASKEEELAGLPV